MRGRRKKRNKIDNQIRASYFKDFNEGLPEGADYRQIKKAVAGMSQDFSTPVVAEYYEGTNFAPQPSSMNQLLMSLWNVALELAFWCLWSGYKIRLKRNNIAQNPILIKCENKLMVAR